MIVAPLSAPQWAAQPGIVMMKGCNERMLSVGHRPRAVAALVVPLLLLASLSGCSASLVGGASATSTTSATPPATSGAAAPTLRTTQIASGACGQDFPDTATLTPAGGLVVTQTSSLGNLAYPSVQISNGQEAQPLAQPPLSGGSGYTPSATAIVNPNLQESGGGFVLAICNASNQAHALSAVQASIARIMPFTEQLQAWQPCTGVYHIGSTGIGGGCGGADFENEYLHAPFAADAAVGATVATTQTGTNSNSDGGPNLGPLPVTLKPGQWMTVEIGVTQPSAPGYYTYAFALTVDAASTGVVAYSQTVLLAGVAHEWDGHACLSSAMQAQIAQQPTPTNNGGFICPES